jgi:autotransporter-associated beta strand protein
VQPTQARHHVSWHTCGDQRGTATLSVNLSTAAIYDGILTGQVGLSKAGAATLTFIGVGNTFSGATTVTAGTLDVGASTTLGSSRAVVVSGGTLWLRNADSLASNAVVRISGSGKLKLTGTGADTVGALYFNGVQQRSGTYGSSASSAQFKSDVFFTAGGVGMLNVLNGPVTVFSVR